MKDPKFHLVIGYHKPDERIFRLAYEDRGVDYSEILHVGDSYTNDYEPATQLGVQARLISDTPHTKCPDNHIIPSINHLLNIF